MAVVAKVEIPVTVKVLMVVVGKAALPVTVKVETEEEPKETLPKLVFPKTVKSPVIKPLPATTKASAGVVVPIPKRLLVLSQKKLLLSWLRPLAP